MTELEGTWVAAGVHLLDVKAAQADAGSRRSVPGGGVIPVGGGDGGNPFNNPVPVPNGYASIQIDDRLWAGLAINAPFGLVVEYDDNFFGRYDSLRSELFTLNVQPSVAYKFSDSLSVGVGVNFQYVDAELTSALPQVSPLLTDGRSRLAGDDVSFGWNIGIAYESGRTRIGLHYRSGINHELRGALTVTGLLGPLSSGNSDRRASVDLNLPDIASFAVRHSFADRFRILASATWYNWSVFDRIEARADEQILASSLQNYRDTFDISAATEIDLGKSLTLRAGTKFDETPTVDAFRTTRVPDGDRIWASFGATFRWDNWEVSGAYAHVFVESTTIARSERFYSNTAAETGTATLARSSGNVDQITMAITTRF
jgi:long-chain fatty acid transport protein